MPRPAPPKTSSVVTGNVWHRSLCATETTTAGTPAMRRNVRLPPAGTMSSAATTRSASPPCGAVTATQTARTSQTSPWSAAAGGRSPRNPAAWWPSSSAGAANVSIWTGSVTARQTARINQMKQTVVSQLFSFCHNVFPLYRSLYCCSKQLENTGKSRTTGMFLNQNIFFNYLWLFHNNEHDSTDQSEESGSEVAAQPKESSFINFRN